MSLSVENHVENTKIAKKPLPAQTYTSTAMFEYRPTLLDALVMKNELWNDETKGLLYAKTQEIGIKPYTPSLLKDDNTAIAKAQKHLIDLIKYYEGDRKFYYEAHTVPYKDKYGTYTCGFGELTDKSMTSQNAYKKLCEKLGNYSNEVRNLLNKRLGQKTFENLPSSIKEGLIDLCYNKGLGKISGNNTLMDAIKQKNYSKVVANLKYVYSGKNDAPKVEDAGLYRRSLNRAILACRDLKGQELEEVKKEIDNIYKNAKACHAKNNISTVELDKIYEQFTKGKISTKAKSAESIKIKIDDRFKGKGVNAITQELFKEIQCNIDYQTFLKDFNELNNNPDKIVLGQNVKLPMYADISNLTQTYNVTIQTNQTSKSNNKTKTQEADTSEESGLLSKIWGTIKSFFANFFTTSKSETPKVDTEASQNSETVQKVELPFQKLVKEGSVKQDGEFQIVSMDYEVKQGDNLSTIAKEFDTSKEILIVNNNIKNKDVINIGQKLKIQKLGYKVKQGDNLFKIAKKFGLTIEMLKDLNNIEDVDKIYPNKILEIPGFIYNVLPGDNLTKISQAVGVSVEDLKRINNLKNNVIHPNQGIKIVYNDSDFAVTSDKKEVKIDKTTNTKTETIDMSETENVKNRKYIQKKQRVNGNVTATRVVFKPTQQGELSGKTILVNAGHGYAESGIDRGANSIKGIEDEWLINYDNAMRLVEQLRSKGAKVIFLQGVKRIVKPLLANKENKADMFISVHGNAAGPSAQDRMQIVYRNTGNSKNCSKQSVKFAKLVANNFDKWISKNEKISKTDAYINPRTKKQDYAEEGTFDESRTNILDVPQETFKTPSIIWEIGFMTSTKGRSRLNNSKLMNQYASIMTQSIIDYFKS